MISFALWIAAVLGPQCAPLSPSMIDRHLTVVLRDIDSQSFNEMGILQHYWRIHCRASRVNASAGIVSNLAKALRRHKTRLLAADLLIDVGANLGVALRDIDTALAEETQLDAAARNASRPILPPTYGVVSAAMRCLKVKAETGRLDHNLCRMIFTENTESDAYWASPPARLDRRP